MKHPHDMLNGWKMIELKCRDARFCVSMSFAYLAAFLLSVFVTGCKFPGGGKEVKLTLKIEVDDLIRKMANDTADLGLNRAILDADSVISTRDTPFIPVFASIYKQQNPGMALAKLFVKSSQHSFSPGSSDEEVIAVITAQAEDAVKRTYRALQRRITGPGGEDNKVILEAKTGFVKAELKTGLSFVRLRSFLLSTGDLQFFETYSNPDFFPMISAANDALAAELDENTRTEKKDTKTEDAEETGKGDTASLGKYLKHKAKKEVEEDIDAARKYPLTTILRPNVSDNEIAPGPIVGYVAIADIRLLTKYLADKAVQSKFPSNIQFMFGDPARKEDKLVPVYVVKLSHDGEDVINGDYVSKAWAEKGYKGAPEVHIEMTVPGAFKWKRMTRRNINNYIAIVYDGKVFSCPRVNDEIATGNTVITGKFTNDEAIDLANILKSGKLALPVSIIESNVND